MIKQGFDNDKYLAMQSDHIRERISKFGDKLYLEFGGKLYDDYHASFSLFFHFSNCVKQSSTQSLRT